MTAIKYLWRRRTTVLGYTVTVLGVLAAADGIFGPQALKVILLLNGIATAVLGHYNNHKLRS